MKNKTDLRVLKTKRNIKDSFIALAKKQDVRTITVNQICDLAECGRNTFYQHYPYKEALQVEIENDIISEVVDSFSPIEDYLPGQFESFSEEYLRLCLSGISRIQEIFPLFPPESEMFSHFIYRLQKQIVQLTHQRTIRHYKICGKEEEKINLNNTYYLVGGIMSFGVYWMMKANYTLEEAIEALRPVFMATVQTNEKAVLIDAANKIYL